MVDSTKGFVRVAEMIFAPKWMDATMFLAEYVPKKFPLEKFIYKRDRIVQS